MLTQIKILSTYKTLQELANRYLAKYKKSKSLDNSGDFIILCSDMSMNNKNETADPAIWYNWMEAVDGKRTPTVLKSSELKEEGTKIQWYEAIDGKRERELPNKKLTIKEGYDAAIRFLNTYADRLESKDIKEFAAQLTFEKWEEAVKKEMKKKDKK